MRGSRVGRIAVAVAAAVCLVAVATGATYAPASTGATKGEIRIGMVAAMTGVYATIGGGNVAGARAAVRQINRAGGVRGKRLVLEVLDDGSNPSQAVIHTQKIANDSKYPAMIGTGFGSAAVAAHQVASAAKIPYVSQSAAATQVYPPKPYVFITPPTSRLMAYSLAGYLRKAGLKKIALLHDPSAYPTEGTRYVKELQRAYGLDIVEDITFSLTQTSFVSELTRIRNSGAQAIWLWNVTPQAVTITKEYKQLRLPQKLVLTGGNATPIYLEPACPDSNGAIINSLLGPVASHLPSGVPTKAITRQVDRILGKRANQFSYDGWAAVSILAQAMEKGGTTRAAINRQLERTKYTGPNGTYVYTRLNHAGLALDDVVVSEIRKCKLVPVKGQNLAAKGKGRKGR